MTAPYFVEHDVTLHHGHALDVLPTLEAGSVQCVVTSPPYYGLRDYGVDGQIGLEPSPAEYVTQIVAVFAEVRRVLADDGVLWLNLGDSYSTRKVVRDSSHQPGFHPDRLDHDTIGKSWAQNASEGNARMPADCGVPEKNLMGIPWRVAFALQDDGWILRNAIIWHKPNAMPESVTDRLSTRYEHVFLLSKSRRYWFDLDAIREPSVTPERHVSALSWDRETKEADVPGQSMRQHRSGRESYQAPGQWADGSGGRHRDPGPNGLGLASGGRNPGDVWTIPTSPFPGAHFATMPSALARRCIQAGCPEDGTVLDPFAGSGTTLMVARQLGRRSVGIELNADYLDLAVKRIGDTPIDFGGVA